MRSHLQILHLVLRSQGPLIHEKAMRSSAMFYFECGSTRSPISLLTALVMQNRYLLIFSSCVGSTAVLEEITADEDKLF